MRIIVPCLFLLLFGINQFAEGQSVQLSDSAKALAEKVKEGNNQSILDAGRSGDSTLIPYLKTLTSRGTPWAQMALAKLGEAEYLNQILSEVDAEDPGKQDRGMEKLLYVGGKEALKKLYQLLDDTSPRENPVCKKETEEFKKKHPEGGKCGFCCDVIYFSRSSSAILILSKMIDNPPTKFGSWGTKKDIAIWKEWFIVNKHLID